MLTVVCDCDIRSRRKLLPYLRCCVRTHRNVGPGLQHSTSVPVQKISGRGPQDGRQRHFGVAAPRNEVNVPHATTPQLLQRAVCYIGGR